MNYGSIGLLRCGTGRSLVGGYYGSIGLLRKLRARDARPYGGFGYSMGIPLILYRYGPI
jgi:hypothetical protein